MEGTRMNAAFGRHGGEQVGSEEISLKNTAEYISIRSRKRAPD
jgi:hypothetical protein